MWNSSRRYASLIQNGYSLNAQLGGASSFFQTLRQAYAGDSVGAIGVIWNGGGAVGSYTVSETAYRDFNDFSGLLVQSLGLHSEKVVAIGGSRGGHGAIGIASHPLVTSVRVAYVLASAPPSDWDLIGKSVSTTIPGLLMASENVTGYVGGWRSSFRSPDLGGANTQDSFLISQTGTSDRSRAASEFSLVGSNRINKLRNNSTSIRLMITSHDFIVPSVGQWQLAQNYLSAGLNIEVERHFLCGHGNCTQQEAVDLSRVLTRLNASNQPRSERFVNPGVVRNYLVNNHTGISESMSGTFPLNPLTIEFPRVILPDVSAPILLTGSPRTHVAIILKESSGKEFGFIVTLDTAGTARYDINSQIAPGAIQIAGVYEVNSQREPISAFVLRSGLKNNAPIIFERYDADTRFLGSEVPFAIHRLAFGNQYENCYVDQALGLGCLTSYGVIELRRRNIDQSDRDLFNRSFSILNTKDCKAATDFEVFSSPDGSNSCRVKWDGAMVGESVKHSASSIRGGQNGFLEGLCIGRDNWNFSYMCPNITGVTCPGGRMTIKSIPRATKECVFHWHQASQGSKVTLASNSTDHNGGILDGTCGPFGWEFNFQCTDSGVKACGGGRATIPSESGSTPCTFSWPNRVIGQGYTGQSETGIGTVSADCIDSGGETGSWGNFSATCR